MFRAKLGENAGYGIDKMKKWKDLTGQDVTFQTDVTELRTIIINAMRSAPDIKVDKLAEICKLRKKDSMKGNGKSSICCSMTSSANSQRANGQRLQNALLSLTQHLQPKGLRGKPGNDGKCFPLGPNVKRFIFKRED